MNHKGKSMDNNLSTSLANDIAAGLKTFEQSDAYKDLIQSKIKKLIEEALDEAIGWRSDFNKQIKDAIQKAMPANVEKAIDLTLYNTLLVQEIKNTWEVNAISSHAGEKAKKVVLDFIEGYTVPEYITMTQLIETFIEMNEDDAAQNQWERPHIFFEQMENSEIYGFGIEDHEEESSRYSYRSEKTNAFQFSSNIYISPVKDEMHDGHPVYRVFSGRTGDTPLGNSSIKQFYSEFDKLIAYIYYGGSKLVLDTTDFDDFSYPHYE